MSTAPASDGPDYGRLANNFILVQSLQTALSRAEMNANTIPKLAIRIIAEDAWREWVIPESGEHVQPWANAADFREFLRSPRPTGCQTPAHVFERMIWDTPAWESYQGLLRGEQGNPKWEEQSRSESGQFGVRIRDSITDTAEPDTIPISQGTPRKRDYQREAPTGTSVSYAHRRLGKERPDLLERVRAKELSCNAAMIEAGFKVREIMLPINPDRAVRLIVRHFKGDDLRRLIDGLANWAGADNGNP